MDLELVAYSQRNPALTPEVAAGVSDLASLRQGQGTFAESVIEFAGRVCYRSTHRMGTAANFIQSRVREAHEDIIEHIVATVWVTGSDEPLRWRLHNRHCEVTELGDGSWLVSGNVRVWLQFFRAGLALAALPLVRPIAPAVFAEFGPEVASGGAGSRALSSALAVEQAPPELARLLPARNGPMGVTLLSYTQPTLADPRLLCDHGSAVFLFEGISRACTHQLVRHRLASFSQESQRYVDLSKGEWGAIVPEAVLANPTARAILEQTWESLQANYQALRALGIRKEDARFLLPNAAETRIVTTMSFAAWQHFLWLRAVDKAAQWEIRLMGQRVLEALYAVAPTLFQAHWDVYQRDFVQAEAP